MGLALVLTQQGTAASTTQATYTVTSTGSAPGTGLALWIGWRVVTAASQTITGITDNVGNAWVPLKSDNDATSTVKADVWHVDPGGYKPGVTTIVVSFSITATSGWQHYEISGAGPGWSGGLDIGAAGHASSTACTATTAALSQVETFAVGGIVWGSNSATISSITAGWTTETLITVSTAPNLRVQAAHQFTAAKTALTYAGTLSASNRWSAIVVTFRQYAGLVQSATATANVVVSGTLTATFATATRAGTLLVAYGGDWSSNSTPTTPTGWQVAWSEPDNTIFDTHFLAYLPANPGGVTAVTIGNTGGGTEELDLIIAEFAGVDTLDIAETVITVPTTTTPAMGTSGSTVVPIELILGAFFGEDNAPPTTFTAGVGYVSVASVGDYFLEYSQSNSVATQSAGCTMGATQRWGGGFATFYKARPRPPRVGVLQAVMRVALWLLSVVM
jgi:hypothetical protein